MSDTPISLATLMTTEGQMGEPSSPTRPTGGTTRGLATVTRGLGGRAPGSMAPSVPPGARPWPDVRTLVGPPLPAEGVERAVDRELHVRLPPAKVPTRVRTRMCAEAKHSSSYTPACISGEGICMHQKVLSGETTRTCAVRAAI